MNEFTEIQKWLIDSDRDYNKGIILLEKYGNSSFLLKILSKSCDKYNELKLYETLDEIYSKLKVEDVKKEDELPIDLKVKKNLTGDLMSERRVIRSELRTLYLARKINEEYFRTQAYRILDITDELDKTFGDITFYKKHGIIAEIAEDERSYKDLYNYRTYLSKYQKALDRGITIKGADLNSTKKIEYLDKVQHYRALIDTIERNLKNGQSTISIE